MTALAAPLLAILGPTGRRHPDAPLLLGAFALAAAAALGAALLLPPPAPPRADFAQALAQSVPRFARTGPGGSPDRLLAEAERLVAARPNDPAALRRAAEVLRAGHHPLQLATLLARLHALTGEAALLREIAALRRSLGDFAGGRAALEGLAAAGLAEGEELAQLAEMRAAAGDAGGAAALLAQALGRQPSGELAWAAARAAAALPEPAPAFRRLGATLGAAAPELLEPLRRALMEDARPDLALALIEGLPPEELAAPATVFRHAEAEARAGFPGSALARLLALRSTEGLPPGAGALLVGLALEEGRLDEAFEVAAALPAEGWTAALPLRLHDAARRAGRPELLRLLDPNRLAARPEAAAVLALARGDRAGALRFARAGLERPSGAAEAARGLAAVLRELGQDQPAWERLRAEIGRPAPEPGAVRLFAELSALPGRTAAALPLLERLRGAGPLAAEAWMRLALQDGRLAEVAAFLGGGGTPTPAAAAEALTLGATLRDPALAGAAALALRRFPALPAGWTPEEAALTATLARPLTSATLSAALDLLAVAAEAEARARLVALLAAAPEIAGAAAGLDLHRHPAVARLRREAEAAGEAGIARLALLAVIAPPEALPLLARRAAAEPGRFGAALVLAQLRAGEVATAEAELRALLPRLPRPQQEGVLFLALAGAPAEARPMLARLAETQLGPGWRRGYEALLARQGRRAELVAALRARAALPGATAAEREEIARRLQELGDPDAAAAVARGG